jgi:hypothetical protein
VTYLEPEEVKLTGEPDNFQRARELWKASAPKAGASAAPAAPGQNPPAEFWAALQERDQARATRNPATFERLTTDGFVVVDPQGRLGDKKERAGRLGQAGGAAPFVPAARLNERTTVYNGDTVVLYWQQQAPAGLEHVTEIWVREAGQWKAAAAHVSRVP